MYLPTPGVVLEVPTRPFLIINSRRIYDMMEKIMIITLILCVQVNIHIIVKAMEEKTIALINILGACWGIYILISYIDHIFPNILLFI